jgi:hypothetical protein
MEKMPAGVHEWKTGLHGPATAGRQGILNWQQITRCDEEETGTCNGKPAV